MDDVSAPRDPEEGIPMPRLTAIETVRSPIQSNVLHLLLHDAEGNIGLGETFYGAWSVEDYVHETAPIALRSSGNLAPQHLAQGLASYMSATQDPALRCVVIPPLTSRCRAGVAGPRMMVSPELDILMVGEKMGLFVVRQIGPLSSAHEADIRIGGAESNVAIASSRLGARSGWVGRAGGDGIGEAIVRTLLGEGVVVTVRRDANRPIGVMVKERRISVHQRVIYYRVGSAVTLTSSSDVSDDLLRTARVLHLTGIISALAPMSKTEVRDVIVRAHALGIVVSYDLNYCSALWSASSAREEYVAIILLVDVLFLGVDEAAILDPRIPDPPSAWTSLRALGARHLIVKDGLRGAHSFSDIEVVSRPAISITVVDTVGGGDAFVAGYLTARLEDESIGGCLDRGLRARSIRVHGRGRLGGRAYRRELALLGRTDPVQR